MKRSALAPLAMVLIAGCAGTSPAPAPTPAAPAASASAPAPPAAASARPTSMDFDRTAMDTSVSACTDFYQYANGAWLARNPIPSHQTTWGWGSILTEENRTIMRKVLEEAAAKPAAQRTANEDLIGNYYASCMNEQAKDAAGLSPLQAELDRIDAIASMRDLQAAILRLQRAGFGVPFSFYSEQDARDSTEVIAEIGQDGLGLPDRDYYFKTDERSQKIRDEYRAHVTKMLELSGYDSARAAKEADAVIKLETALAQASMTRVERRDPEAVYNRMNLAKLAETAPNIDWRSYLRDRGLPSVESINVSQPKFIAEVSKQFAVTPLAEWKSYLRWHWLTEMAPTLTSSLDAEDFRFSNGVLRGQPQPQPRWQRCVAAANAQIGEAIGQAWVDQKFNAESKRRATELVDNLLAALREDLQTLDWMSEETRQQAQKKLSTFVRKIGYPDQWRDYSKLRMTAGPYASNVLAANVWDEQRDLDKIGKPVDRTEWFMTPSAYNAYYAPSLNEIVFPAGILQWPMFDIAQDDAYNYGAIGSVIGHEISHGFDDRGSQYDSEGNLKNWWTTEDRKKFEARAQCIIDQFNAYEIEPGVAHNGKLVAGESIADLGGLVIAWSGYQKSLAGKPRPPVIDGLTPEQRFFLGFARRSATNIRPEAARLRVATDPHPINQFRINGTVSNMPEFAQAFGCKPGDPMVREHRCEIW